jgi:LPXTG-site transpeptidase (sortase) family protein
MQKSRWLTFCGGVLIIGGAVLSGVYYWMEHAASRAQQDAQEWFSRSVTARQAVPKAPSPPERRLHHGDVVGRLTIPRIHLSVMVFEGDDASILKRGAGRIPATSLPYENGNLGIAAHRDTFFRPLRLIHPRDVIEFTSREGVSRYTVTDIVIVPPSDVRVLAQSPGRDLTLVTCYPFYYLGSAPKRWIVHAKRMS